MLAVHHGSSAHVAIIHSRTMFKEAFRAWALQSLHPDVASLPEALCGYVVQCKLPCSCVMRVGLEPPAATAAEAAGVAVL